MSSPGIVKTEPWPFTYEEIHDHYENGVDPIRGWICPTLTVPGGKRFPIQNGWPSMRRQLWEEVRFEEGNGERQTGEDCRLGGKVIMACYNFSCILSDLGLMNGEQSRKTEGCLNYRKLL
eukprot:TRINITY_DN5599_c1_g1_i3.p1 TRINITY_DN5599_c1_g1~~TRINITY_DN5599_c1_g1_i3.p1  ORF type:complete len:120 (+),score=3.92 TRINITY_DN5599_c1_g1_i3:267-626(+)